MSRETTTCSNADIKRKKTTKSPAPTITRGNRFSQRGEEKKKAASRKLTGTADGGGAARANMTPVGEEIKGKGSAVSSPSDEQ